MEDAIMTIIFQLFSAEDLQKLTLDDLKELRTIITDTLEESKAMRDEHHGLALPLETADDVKLPWGTPPQVTEALQQRFYDVSQQLKVSQPISSQFDFEKLLKRHLNQDDETKAKEKMILEWAISCEVNNFKFYARLLRARKRAYEFFASKTGEQEPQGPDSLYSPFYYEHPLYNLFYGISQPGPDSTQYSPSLGRPRPT
jgi:hypothetical protein